MKLEEGKYMKTALLLVDIQNDYFPHGKMEYNPVEASEYASQLLQFFRTKNEPIFHIQHVAIKRTLLFPPIQKVYIFMKAYAHLKKKPLYSNIIQIVSRNRSSRAITTFKY